MVEFTNKKHLNQEVIYSDNGFTLSLLQVARKIKLTSIFQHYYLKKEAFKEFYEPLKAIFYLFRCSYLLSNSFIDKYISFKQLIIFLNDRVIMGFMFKSMILELLELIDNLFSSPYSCLICCAHTPIKIGMQMFSNQPYFTV